MSNVSFVFSIMLRIFFLTFFSLRSRRNFQHSSKNLLDFSAIALMKKRREFTGKQLVGLVQDSWPRNTFLFNGPSFCSHFMINLENDFCLLIFRFSMDQMFEVVADVENYFKFVPFCKKSMVYNKKETSLSADLVIGFPPLNER